MEKRPPPTVRTRETWRETEKVKGLCARVEWSEHATQIFCPTSTLPSFAVFSFLLRVVHSHSGCRQAQCLPMCFRCFSRCGILARVIHNCADQPLQVFLDGLPSV